MSGTLYQESQDYTNTNSLTIKKKREVVSEALLKFHEEDMNEKTSIDFLNILKQLISIDPTYSLTDKKELVRQKDQKYYDENKAFIENNYSGKYLVIAEGEIKAIGNNLNDVKDVANQFIHRFVFKVEPENKRRGSIRWPVRPR